MANKPSSTQGSDEIDLGQLFQLIGRGFQKLFDFFAKIFNGIFRLLILFLLFIQKNFLIFLTATVLGAIGGFVIDELRSERYISKMLVEPNFNSAQQLYNNIDFYNDLAKAEDSVSLSKALEITSGEAASIKKVYVESYSDENQKIKLFDDFMRTLDTSTVKAIEFESYLKNFNSIDARFHQISLVSTDNSVAKKAQNAIIKSISANSYFKIQKQINDENLGLQQAIYNKQLSEIDSLQELYKTVLVKEADKPMQGTNINLAENGEAQNKELALIQEREVLKQRLVALNRERANKSNILNIISDFPNRGVELKGFWDKFLFFLPVLALMSSLFLLLLIETNKYLMRQKQ